MHVFSHCNVVTLGLLFSVTAVASPPIPDDISLRLHVVSTSDPGFGVGTHAVLAFEVAQHGPIERDLLFFIYNESIIAEANAQQITLTQNAASACDFSSYDTGYMWGFTISQQLPALHESVECLVNLEVLPGAQGGYIASFTAVVNDPEDGYDPNPRNNRPVLLVGQPTGPLSVPFSTSFLLLLVLALVGAGAAVRMRDPERLRSIGRHEH